MINISVICPCLNEENFIVGCVESMISQDAFNGMELLFVDGGSTDRTRFLLEPYIAQYEQIKMLDNPKRTAPCAMNIGIKEAKGEYIVRIDAHSKFPTNYVSTLVKKLQLLPQAQNVGCSCKTMARNESKKAKAIAEVLCNKFGIGDATFRLGTNEIKEVDTVPFGCFRKKDFETFGYYDERLTRNQDIELNHRIRQKGGKIYLIPNIESIYYARDNYKDLIKNNFSNGKWNILTVFYTKQYGALSIRHFIPLCFVLALFIPLLFSFLYLPLAIISIIALLAYVFLYTIISCQLAVKKNLSFFYLFFAFICLHISYGLGSFIGLICLLFR